MHVFYLLTVNGFVRELGAHCLNGDGGRTIASGSLSSSNEQQNGKQHCNYSAIGLQLPYYALRKPRV